MKKMRFLAFMLMAAAVSFTACNKDEEEDPNLDKTPVLTFNAASGFTADDHSVKIGEEFKIGVIATANDHSGAKLTNILFQKVQNNETEVVIDRTINEAMYNWDTTLSLIPITKDVIGEVNWECIITDKDGETKKISLKTTVVEAIEKRGIKEFGAQDDVIGSFYSVEMDSILDITTAPLNQEKIDFVFYHGQEFVDSYAAIDDEGAHEFTSTFNLDAWTTQNATRFQMIDMTGEEFDALEDNYDSWMTIPEFNDAEGLTSVTKLSKDDIFMFKTVNDVIGVAKVVDLYTKGHKSKLDIIIKK